MLIVLATALWCNHLCLNHAQLALLSQLLAAAAHHKANDGGAYAVWAWCKYVKHCLGWYKLILFPCLLTHFRLVVWRSSDTFHLTNEVTLCWDPLVFGWVTACGQVNHLGM